jgi:hypothetical protein
MSSMFDKSGHSTPRFDNNHRLNLKDLLNSQNKLDSVNMNNMIEKIV